MTDHHLDKSGNFVSARTSPASSNISGYCYKHDTDYTGRCPWCPVEAVIPPEIIKAFEKAKADDAAAGNVLELKHEWALTTLDFGGVHFERMIGGVRVSMRLPDGTAISEEFTSEEFYEFMYRRMNREEEPAWQTWLFLAAVAWVFVAGIAAFLSGV